jgi:CheY-like chemotaxis protein
MWVLVVDDSPSSLIFISQALRSLGHSALTCLDATAALETLRTMKTDVVLVDYHMPGMNALGFIAALRSQGEATAATPPPLVIMTADASPTIAEAALARGAAAVLHKPLSLDALASVLDAVANSLR